jgi:hypothetical protein
MILPQGIADLLTNEECRMLFKLYGTDLFKPYLARLKVKYRKMYEVLGEDE